MKKSLVISLILAIFVTGCKTKTFTLEDKYYEESGMMQINTTGFDDLIKNKESFAIFIYEPSCVTSSDFNNVLTEFTEKYNINIYKLSFQEMKNTDLSKYITFCPSFAIYKQGKLIDYLDAEDNNDTEKFKSLDSFSNWFFSYVSTVSK